MLCRPLPAAFDLYQAQGKGPWAQAHFARPCGATAERRPRGGDAADPLPFPAPTTAGGDAGSSHIKGIHNVALRNLHIQQTGEPARASVTWDGAYPFRLNAVAVHEDTLRVTSSCRAIKEGLPLRMVLPTLCISSADAKFQNQNGGDQNAYPQSLAYGPVRFDPPVLIHGEDDVQRLTCIRGAHRVEIGTREAVVDTAPTCRWLSRACACPEGTRPRWK